MSGFCNSSVITVAANGALKGKSHVSHVSHTKTVTQSVTQSCVPVVQSQRKKLVFGWIQDVSGSMAGGRIDASIKGLESLRSEVLQDEDYLSLVLFNTNTTKLHSPMVVKNIDHQRNVRAIRESIDGRTALYDGLGAAIEEIKAMRADKKYNSVTKDAVYELLVLTDGGDNSSVTFSLETLSTLVAQPGIPNFNLHVVGVSMDHSDKEKLLSLCKPRHCSYIDVSDLTQLSDKLSHIRETVKKRLVMTTTTTVVENVVVVGSGSAHVHGPVDQLGGVLQRMRLQSTPTPVQLTLTAARPAPTRCTVPGKTAGKMATGKMATGKTAGKTAVCAYWLKGGCKFGSTCRDAHSY